MEIRTREATVTDAADIVAFQLAMARETEELELDAEVVARGVRAVFDRPSRGRYFVAEDGGEVIASLLITYEWSDWRDGDIWWVQSVYVHPDHRKVGAFKALYRHAEQAARDAGAVGIRLYVDEHNEGAQAAYVRLGMHLSNYKVMEVMFGG